MGHGVFIALLAGTLPATAAADGFAEVAGGIMTPGGSDSWVNLGGTSPKVAVRAGTMDRKWADEIVSIDWTPIRPGAADTSAHRFRAIGSFSFNARVGALNLSARTGVGIDILRVRRSLESDTDLGYAFEVGAGVWFATGPVELGSCASVLRNVPPRGPTSAPRSSERRPRLAPSRRSTRRRCGS